MDITRQGQLGYVKLKLAITEIKDSIKLAKATPSQIKLPQEVFNCENVRTICYSK